MSVFSDRLIALRKEMGYSQYALADAMGMPRSSYSGYETMGKQPPFDTLIKIAKLLCVNVDYLIGATDIRSPKAQTMVLREIGKLRSDIDSAPIDIRESVADILSVVYDMIKDDVQSNNATRLKAYKELFEAIIAGREKVSHAVSNAALLKAQAEMMTSVNDELMKIFVIDTKED